MHVNPEPPRGCGGLQEPSAAVSTEGRLWIIFGNDDVRPPGVACLRERKDERVRLPNQGQAWDQFP
jgi:hypothetical protein